METSNGREQLNLSPLTLTYLLEEGSEAWVVPLLAAMGLGLVFAFCNGSNSSPNLLSS